jgi:twitching motility protein PilT
MSLSILDLFKRMDGKEISDVHLQVGSVPMFRIKGDIEQMKDMPALTLKDMEDIIKQVLTEENIKQLKSKGSVDMSLGISGTGRFRINVFKQRGSISFAARLLNTVIPDFETLHIPSTVCRVTDYMEGLVLITGATGAGKSSTMAAIINYINQRRKCHILCIEDPIEYLYKNEKSLINQREVGIDFPSFKDALRSALREDPDVILIGEMRDIETVEFGLHAAETGHLVFGTLHSADAAQTIGRLIGFFPEERHSQIRKGLSLHLKAVISQMLLPSCKEGLTFVPATEIMFVNDIISRLIVEGADAKVAKSIIAGKLDGMQDFETSLCDLVKNKMIDLKIALRYADNPESLDRKMRGIFLEGDTAILS